MEIKLNAPGLVTTDRLEALDCRLRVRSETVYLGSSRYTFSLRPTIEAIGSPAVSNSKVDGECAGGSRPGVAQRSRDTFLIVVRVLLSGWFEEDLESESFELADVVAFAAFGVGVGVVELGSEVVEACLGV